MAGISTPPSKVVKWQGRHCTGGRQSLHPAGTNESELHRRVIAMRAETQKIVEEIKQSVGLLRRHL